MMYVTFGYQKWHLAVLFQINLKITIQKKLKKEKVHLVVRLLNCLVRQIYHDHVKPQLHCHDFGHDGATTHPDISSRDASAWVVAAP